MIDRVIANTDLQFDLDACLAYNNSPTAGELVHVHNEYTKLWRLFCPLPARRKHDESIDQHIHPVATRLNQRPVIYKANKKHVGYPLGNAFSRLDVLKDEFISNGFISQKFKPFSKMV
jgi:hypothetical protein